MPLRSFNTVIHLVVMAILFLASPYAISELVMIATCMLVCWTATFLVLAPSVAETMPHKSGLAFAIVVLYWVAYLSKFALALFIASEFWVVPLLISEAALIDSLPSAYLIATVGYLSVLAGIFIVPNGRKFTWEIPAHQSLFMPAALLLCIALAIKTYLKAVYSLAIPSVEPVQLDIPYATGILSLIIDTGIIFPANIPLAMGLFRGKMSWTVVGAILALLNAGIDLGFGAKDTLIYQLIIGAVMFSVAWRGPSPYLTQVRPLVRRMLVPIGIFSALVILMYPYVNPYRFARLEGNDFFRSIEIAFSKPIYEDSNPFITILDRITGIDVMTGVINLRNFLSNDAIMQNLFSTELVDNVALQIFGFKQDETLFSVTQMAYFYVVGGYTTVIAGCLLVGIFFGVVQQIAVSLPVKKIMKVAFLPVMWILAAKLMLGGGNLVLAAKELSVVLGMFIACSLLAGLKRSRSTTVKAIPKVAVGET